MLRLRILTGVILSCILAVVLFVLAPGWSVLVFGVVWTIAAWEWAGFGALKSGWARTLYAGAMALLLLLSWQWTADPRHLLVLLAGACLWWVVAFLWLVLAPERRQPRLALLCGVPVLVPAFVALARLQTANHGTVRGPQLVLWLLLLVFAADIGAFFAGRKFGRRKLAPRVSPRQDVGGCARRTRQPSRWSPGPGRCASACRRGPASRSVARSAYSRWSAI